MKRFLQLCAFLFCAHAAQGQQLNVLFIGNSYTHYNNMPKIFEHLARSKGKNVYADSIAVSNSTLKLHTERPSTYKKIKARKWDVVFIQGFSRELAQDSAVIATETIPYARMIIDSVQRYNPCASIYFYMTWGYADGYSIEEYNNTYAKMQENVKRGYFQLSRTFNFPIAPVGMVWQQVREMHPEMNLYVPDKEHPNPSGSFIAACTFYASIFKESPVGGTAPEQVNPDVIAPIARMAEKYVLNNLEKYNLDTIQHPALEIPPVLNFDIKESWTNITITNKTRNCPDIKWDFGDGNTSRKLNPKHYYKKSGTYTVTLHVYKNCQHYILKKRITVSKEDKFATSNPKPKTTSTAKTTPKGKK
jgi:PKD repeat protein